AIHSAINKRTVGFQLLFRREYSFFKDPAFFNDLAPSTAMRPSVGLTPLAKSDGVKTKKGRNTSALLQEFG
ncbi:MAG: hypothetical protein AAGA22_08470, partial [Pseudomonadota bacterium]